MAPKTEATSSKKRRVKPSIWRRLFAWGPIVLVILLWAHSLIYSTGWTYDSADDATMLHVELESNAGSISFQLLEGPTFFVGVPPESDLDFSHHVNPIEGGLLSAFPSHDWSHSARASGRKSTYVSIPYWWFAIVVSMWLAFLVWWRKRRGATDCLKCGYDLRGSKGACPECGTVPKSQKASV